MRTIANIITQQMEKAPRVLIRKLIERKLKATGAPFGQADLDALVEHALSDDDTPFHWASDEGEPDEVRELTLTFTDEDSAELKAAITRLTDGLPAMIQMAADKTTASLYKRLREDWAVQGAFEAYQADEFRERLEERWGEGLDLLRMLLTCCRELGTEAYKRHRRSKSKRRACRRFVLTRLHVRALQVTDEIICLLENGFADGAMARWRTLHELAVVATLIADGDEDLAERYINHDRVDVKRQADDYEATQAAIGQPPLSKRQRKDVDAVFDAAIEKYGAPFATPYGWAAERLKMKRPTFDKLQEEAGRGSMSPLYKLASYNVHAGSRSMFHRLTSLGEEDVLVAGRSNAGLPEPAANTAHSLLLITSYMEDGRSSLDRTAELNAVLKIRDAVTPAFEKADRKLRRDDKAFRRGGSKS